MSNYASISFFLQINVLNKSFINYIKNYSMIVNWCNIIFSRSSFVFKFLKLLCKNFQFNSHFIILQKILHFEVFSTKTPDCFTLKHAKPPKIPKKSAFLPGVVETFKQCWLVLERKNVRISIG